MPVEPREEMRTTDATPIAMLSTVSRVRFALRENKVLLFHKQTQSRIRF